MCCGTCHAEQTFPVPLPADRVARFSLSAKRSASRLVQSMTDLTGFRSDGIHAANEHSHDLMRSISDLQVRWKLYYPLLGKHVFSVVASYMFCLLLV